MNTTLQRLRAVCAATASTARLLLLIAVVISFEISYMRTELLYLGMYSLNGFSSTSKQMTSNDLE